MDKRKRTETRRPRQAGRKWRRAKMRVVYTRARHKMETNLVANSCELVPEDPYGKWHHPTSLRLSAGEPVSEAADQAHTGQVSILCRLKVVEGAQKHDTVYGMGQATLDVPPRFVRHVCLYTVRWRGGWSQRRAACKRRTLSPPYSARSFSKSPRQRSFVLFFILRSAKDTPRLETLFKSPMVVARAMRARALEACT